MENRPPAPPPEQGLPHAARPWHGTGTGLLLAGDNKEMLARPRPPLAQRLAGNVVAPREMGAVTATATVKHGLQRPRAASRGQEGDVVGSVTTTTSSGGGLLSMVGGSLPAAAVYARGRGMSCTDTLTRSHTHALQHNLSRAHRSRTVGAVPHDTSWRDTGWLGVARRAQAAVTVASAGAAVNAPIAPDDTETAASTISDAAPNSSIASSTQNRISFYETFKQQFPAFVRENAKTARRQQELLAASVPSTRTASSVSTSSLSSAAVPTLDDANDDKNNHDDDNLSTRLHRRLAYRKAERDTLAVERAQLMAKLQKVVAMIERLEQKRTIYTGRLTAVDERCNEVDIDVRDLAQAIVQLEHVDSEDFGKGQRSSSSANSDEEDDYANVLGHRETMRKTIDRRFFTNADSCVKTLTGHTLPITCLDFVDPHGGALVTASEDGTIRLWDLGRWRLLKTLHAVHASAVRCLQYNGDVMLSGGDDGVVKLWRVPDIATTPLSHFDHGTEDEWLGSTLRGHCGAVRCLQYAATNERLVTGSADNSVRVWNVAREECTRILSLFDNGSEEAAKVDNVPLTTGYPFETNDQYRGVGALQHYEHALATGGSDGIVRLFDLRTRDRPVMAFRTAPTSPVYGSARSPSPGILSENGGTSRSSTSDGDDGAFSATASTTTYTTSMTTPSPSECLRKFASHNLPITTLQFDDHHLVTGALDRRINVWDLRTGTIVEGFLAPSANGIQHLQFDRDKIVAATGGEEITIFERGTRRQHVLRGHAAPVRWFKYEGQRLISGAEAVKLWDI